MSWFRFYSDTIHDRKIRRLSLAHRWLWVTILCLAKDSPEPGRLLLSRDVPVTADDLADSASVPLKQVESGLKALEEQRMVHWRNEVLIVTHWDDRQFTSDDSNNRVKRHRDKKRNDDVTLHNRYGNDVVTPPETEYREQITDPETDQKKEEILTREIHVTRAETAASVATPEEHSSSSLDPVFGQVVKLYESEGFGMLSDTVREQLDYLQTEFGAEWLTMSLKEAVLQNKRRLKYVAGVLQNWRADGGPRTSDTKVQARNKGAPKAGNSLGSEGSTANGQQDPRYAAFYELFPDTT